MAERDMKFSGITAPLPGGSYDVAALREGLGSVKPDTNGAKVHETIAKAVGDALQAVPVAYQEEPVKPFSETTYCPDGHELKEVDGLDGIRRTMAVPIKGDDDDQDLEKKGEKADGPKGATAKEMAARAAAPAPPAAPAVEAVQADDAGAAAAASGGAGGERAASSTRGSDGGK